MTETSASPTPHADEADATARLYLAVIRLNRTLRRDAKEAVIGHGGLSALATLIADGPQRAGALAAAEGVTAPAMTKIVNYLEQLGYVERSTDPDDGRAQLVAATTEGQALVLQGRAARMQSLRERFLRLPEDRQDAIAAALEALEELTEGPDAG